MSKPSKRQKGAVHHAEGQHGDKTHAAFLDQLNASARTEGDAENAGPRDNTTPRLGKHRMSEDRQQHDEADKNSEKNRA